MKELTITIVVASKAGLVDVLEEILLGARNRPTLEDNSDLREWESEGGTVCGYQVEVRPATMTIYGEDVRGENAE